MGPLEKRLLSEFAIYLIKNSSRAADDSPQGESLDLAECRRWFARTYREWQLTPRVDLAGRSPYEVINAERAAHTGEIAQTLPKPSIELYTDLPTLLPADGDTRRPRDSARPIADSDDPAEVLRWRQLADRLFGSWLDEKLDRL